MNEMIPIVQMLVGRGVSFCVEHRNALTVHASESALDDVDLTVLKRGRNLLINCLPIGCLVTASQLLKAMQHYMQCVQDMRTVQGIERYTAESKAIPLMRSYVRALVA